VSLPATLERVAGGAPSAGRPTTPANAGVERLAASPARVERVGFTVAACAAIAVAFYAALQIASQHAGGPHAPAGAIPLFWRAGQAAIASSLAAPGFWWGFSWIAGACPRRARARILSALIGVACAAIAACAVLWP